MKSKFLTTTLLATAMFAGAGIGLSPAMAQGYPGNPGMQQPGPQGNYTPGIDQAQEAIHVRIQQGMQSGQITPSEAQALYRRDREIQLRENQFRANGNVNGPERQQLRTELAALGNDVERMISNRDVVGRPGTPGIDNAEFRIHQRIEEGVRDGRITQSEAGRLYGRERAIADHEARIRADGVVTSQERRNLRDQQIALRDAVEKLINNRHRRG